MVIGTLMCAAGCSTLSPGAHASPRASAHTGTTAIEAHHDSPLPCPPATIAVATAAELHAALRRAAPGTVIEMADGSYGGEFAAAATGSDAAPIWLCGSQDAVLQGSGVDEGYVLHLQGVSHWRLVGFTVRQGKKGVFADGVTDSILRDLTVDTIGDEAVHLRSGSSRNLLQGLDISGTGLRAERFGEGIYVGSSESNWCQVSNCEPDRSDGNSIVGSTIQNTTAEAIDVKEGTTGGVLRDNVFDGSGMRGDADSWVDVKGNDWLIQGNRGTFASGSGFEVHQLLDGWGTGNVFDGNIADVRGPGFGFELRPVADNRVTCSNTALAAGQGLSNTTCG
jgi:hypothetical protein